MKQGRLRSLGTLILTVVVSSLAVTSALAQAKLESGTLAGVVRDTAGTPQMGASVQLIPETGGIVGARTLLTNTQGVFRGERITPGFYALRVTLAGFLPTFEKRVRISPNLTTVVRIELESVFASLDQLRRAPSNASADADDWKWVLRSASAVRPVLEWVGEESVTTTVANSELNTLRLPRFRMEFTDGARRSLSASSIASSPATAVAFDQKLGGSSRLIIAGQASYDEDTPGGGIATVWLPTGTIGAGPHTALVLREAKLGPAMPTFRGARLEQGGTLALGDRLVLQYGGEYVLVGLGAAASSLRPRVEMDVRVSHNWQAAMIFASMPAGLSPFESNDERADGPLTTALNELDAFPALLWRHGKPVLQGGWHEEIAAERNVGNRSKFQIAGFHDDDRHVAVFGRRNYLPADEYFQGYDSYGFAYDGGGSTSWGTRIAYSRQIDRDLEWTAVYSFGGALSVADGALGSLRDKLTTSPRQSFGIGISGRLPWMRTKLQTRYKWINGPALSRVDGYGESLFQMDPYLSVSVHQPLPKFGVGRWEAIADCDNLLAQGYVSTTTRDGRIVLVPAFRTFRGGLSVQF